MKTLRRRDLLRFGTAGMLAWPLLSSARSSAQAASAKKRFVTVFSSSGVRQDIFWPKGSTGDLATAKYTVDGTSLEGLKPYLSDVIIPKGVRIDRGGGDSHDAGSDRSLTGYPLKSQNSDQKPFATGPSLDQLLATNWEPDARAVSLARRTTPGQSHLQVHLLRCGRLPSRLHPRPVHRLPTDHSEPRAELHRDHGRRSHARFDALQASKRSRCGSRGDHRDEVGGRNGLLRATEARAHVRRNSQHREASRGRPSFTGLLDRTLQLGAGGACGPSDCQHRRQLSQAPQARYGPDGACFRARHHAHRDPVTLARGDWGARRCIGFRGRMPTETASPSRRATTT